uniref:26S proteasome non-ATPase regulatory subunit 9 n=1 Tax=Kalanchoe fedtschenkoi TaxID=63787 RepID=A0A7N0U0J6_KALFE
MDIDVSVKVPFALVDELTEGSPSAEDGLQLGDQIVKFGNVESGPGLLSRLASEAQTNQGREVPVVLLRQGVVLTTAVTPRTWQGRGLLGCHFQILSTAMTRGCHATAFWNSTELQGLLLHQLELLLLKLVMLRPRNRWLLKMMHLILLT